MIRRALLAMLEHPQRGIPVLLVLSLFPFLGWLSPIVLALFCLRWQLSWSVVAMGTACLGAFLQSYFWIAVPLEAWSHTIVWLPILAKYLPIFLLATVWRITVSLPLMLYASALLGSVCVLLTQQTVGYLAATQLLQQHFDVLYQGAQTSPDVDKEVWSYLIKLIPMGVFLSFLSSLLFARWLQARLFYPDGFAKEFYGYRIEKSFAVVASVLTACILLVNMPVWAEATVLVWLSLPGLAGVALVHAWVQAKNKSVFWLVGFYASWLFAMQVLPPVLLAMGLLDSFYNWRHRWMSS